MPQIGQENCKRGISLRTDVMNSLITLRDHLAYHLCQE
jgi:hypothetical protein